VFFAAVLVTILTTKEYPPDDMEEFEAMKRDRSGVGHTFKGIFQGIGSMPYAMLANVIPGAKMGFYMGVFKFFHRSTADSCGGGIGGIRGFVVGWGCDESCACGWGFHGDRLGGDLVGGE
jgi:hypothetical protein